MSRPHSPGPGDGAVGYGRPPVASRFVPGRSGNPHGRPKKRMTVGDHLREALLTRNEVVENGRKRKRSAQEIIIRNLVHEAARKNLKAVTALFALQHRYASAPDAVLDPAVLPAEDRDILQAFIDDVQGRTDRCEPEQDGSQGVVASAEPQP